jgi:arabinose-5-phosphate isomerase
MGSFDALAYGRTVLDTEARAIHAVRARLGKSFAQAVDVVLACKGRVVTTAIGKPGFLAQKLSATLASVGVPSHYLHPAEAAHGDLGRLAANDLVIALSNSGATEELLRLLVPLKRLGVRLLTITGDARSALARGSDLVIELGPLQEAGPLQLVPTASSAALHAVADALAMTVAQRAELNAERYALLHPGGTLGRAVLKVSELMRQSEQLPKVRDTATLARAVVVMTNTPGRPGATLVVNAKGTLVGIFTDGDLRRLAKRRRLNFKVRMSTVMGKNPRVVRPEELVLTAATLMREAQVDQLPVVDAAGRAIGLLDVQDLLAARVVSAM